MKPADEILRRFFELDAAWRWAFDCTDGAHCEGYALEVEPGRVLFGYGGPLAPAEPEWISFERIGVDKLWYWNDHERRWICFPPMP